MSSLFLQHQSKHEEQKKEKLESKQLWENVLCNVRVRASLMRLHQNGEE